jgi:hypothetical protein
LDPEKAWRWLALGGFIDEDLSSGTGSFTIDFVKSMGEYLSELKFESPLLTCNTFHLRLEAAELKERAKYQNGRVKLIKCYLRSGKVFPLDGGCGLLHFILSHHTNIADITGRLMAEVEGMRKTNPALRSTILLETIRALEALTYDGWIAASYDSTGLSVDIKREYLSVHWEP